MSNTSGPDFSLNQSSFDMERMMRQNAHEKAFEINVLAQRAFEKEKSKIVFDSEQIYLEELKDKREKIKQDLNIKRSKKINSARLLSMSERNRLMDELKNELKI